MRKVDFVPFLLTDTTDIFSIRIEGEQHTEVEKFLVLFKDSENHYVQADLESILKAISNISQNGALESFFRPEGSRDDRIVALPIYVVPRNREKEGTLRLYGIRVSDNLLIVGGGGLKTTQTYEEDEALHKHVVLLQRIDRTLKMLSSQGVRVQDEIFNLTIEID